MTNCIHDWQPVPLRFRRFVCRTCGRSGYKRTNGVLYEHKQQQTYDDPRAQTMHVGGTRDGTARRGKRGPGGWS